MAWLPEQSLGLSWTLHDNSAELQMRRNGLIVTLMGGQAARATGELPESAGMLRELCKVR
ncbi:hypothetical protein [Paucibacter sp. PLA-PC-4]|uniref:hypothetical protein n=1 Tax=Paucibacter sp. PLA-PC-4 TaxID=2993655 RepID=UPI0022497304|nr:hypothetical protein [Paucibacter sp. PLA-PC-4]